MKAHDADLGMILGRIRQADERADRHVHLALATFWEGHRWREELRRRLAADAGLFLPRVEGLNRPGW